MHSSLRGFALIVSATGLLSTGAQAHDVPPAYDHVELSASAEQEVENDLLVASVYAEAQAERQREAADQVNTTLQWALDTARGAQDVKTQTTQYNTYPVYAANNRIVGWQARQALRLESRDAKTLSELLGKLQERVAIESVHYDVSKAARDAAEEQLMSAALAQFRKRAELITKELGRDGYRIVRVNIGTGGAPPIPVVYRTPALAAEADVAAPAVEAGVQTVNVSVNGTIELNPVR
jgi:predicted secreted protein